MNYPKSLLLLFFLHLSSFTYGQFTDEINSNRPGESMSAFSVGKTVFQTEMGFTGIYQEDQANNYKSNAIASELTLRYGALLEELEFIVTVQHQKEWYTAATLNQTRGAIKQTFLGAKYLIFDPTKNYETKPNFYSWKANHKFSYRSFIPAVGVYAGFNLNFSDNPFSEPIEDFISPKVSVITQNQFGKFVLVSNIFVDNITATYRSLGYIVTLTRGFNPNWSGFIENKGVKSDLFSEGIVRGGAAFLFKENIQFDASLGTNFKQNPSKVFGGIGVSWRFDENYNKVMLRIPKKDKDKDKSKKKDKKEKGTDKSKKRKDEV